METNHNLLMEYVREVAAAERGKEEQLREFAKDGDDEDVQALFLAGAGQSQALSAALGERAGDISGVGVQTGLNAAAARLIQSVQIQEVRTVQNLITAYTLEAGACAMLQALSIFAGEAQNDELSGIAREGQKACSGLAERLFHLIPTRSIIAYNMLTISEIDPAVATKYKEASWST